MEKRRLVLLASGQSRGTNMRAIIRACQEGRLPAEVVAAFLTNPASPAWTALSELRVPVHRQPPTDEEFLASLEALNPDLICLCGYMRKLPIEIVKRHHNKVVNVHPALLPKYGGKGMYGLRIQEAVLAAGETETGCTVHYVEEEYDTGPTILQARISVEPHDTPETLAARLLPLEHETYIQALAMLLAKLRSSQVEPQ